VSRFGQQGDGARPESTRRFYEGEGCKNAQRDPQAALARDLAYVVMAMIMAWAGVSVFPTLPAWRLDGSVSMGGHADALLIGIPRSR
jgi:membrane associated rhomboid family serine protease